MLLGRADSSVKFAKHRTAVRHLDAEVQRRLADLRAEADRIGTLLVEMFGLDAGDGPRGDGDAFEPYAD